MYSDLMSLGDRARRLALFLSFAGAAAACSGEAPIAVADQAGEEPANNTENVEAPEWVQEANAAPGFVDEAYPAAPYGEAQGATIANLRFAGWSDPLSVNYDSTEVQLLNLSSFYDPDNKKDVELLIINAVAIWCGVCQREYADMDQAGLYQSLRPRGVEMLGILFEDADGAPATYTDLTNWAEFFHVEFPFVLDPGFKSGVYFDRSATPMNMVVDAKTMKILFVMTGYDPAIYDEVETILQQRGR